MVRNPALVLVMLALNVAATAGESIAKSPSTGRDDAVVLWERRGPCPSPRTSYGACERINPHLVDFRRDIREIRIPLPKDVHARAERIKSGPGRPSGLCWLGQFTDGGLISLAITPERALAGEILTRAGDRYRVTFEAGRGYLLQELDTRIFNMPPQHMETPAKPEPSSPIPAACASDPPTRIDVLFAYTDGAAKAAGGRAQLQARVQLAVCETNWSYEDAGLKFHIRSVGVRGVGAYPLEQNTIYPVANIKSDVINGQNGLGNVRVWRDAVGADFGILLVDRGWLGGNAKQFAPRYVGNEGAFALEAYAVIDMTPLTGPGAYMVAHELGHMMGANHQKNMQAEPGLTPESNAHLHEAPSASFPKGWMTIMGDHYPGSCVECMRILRWSTSDKNRTFDGQPLGAPAGDEDNAKTLEQAASTAANMRCQRVP